MQALVNICSTINRYLSCVILIIMVGLVAGNTFLRYFFSSGIIITEEFVRYLFMWVVYLGAVSVRYGRAHIRVTTITDRLSPRGQLQFDAVFEVVSILVLGTLCYGSYQYYFDTTTVGQVTGIPYSMMILAVLIGTLCCAVISLGHIKEDLSLLKLSDAELAERKRQIEAELEAQMQAEAAEAHKQTKE